MIQLHLKKINLTKTPSPDTNIIDQDILGQQNNKLNKYQNQKSDPQNQTHSQIYSQQLGKDFHLQLY
jgi:hypothetical protein